MNGLTLTTHKGGIEDRLVQLQANMFNFALSLTADRESAEDLTQDTSLKVLTNKDKFHEDTFKGWVFTVMRNLFYQYHRVARTQTIIDTNADIAYVGGQSDSEGLVAPDREMNLQEINQAIDALSQDIKEPFSMFVSGYKYKEIAETLDLPVGTVKSRIFFARKQLEETLKRFPSRFLTKRLFSSDICRKSGRAHIVLFIFISSSFGWTEMSHTSPLYHNTNPEYLLLLSDPSIKEGGSVSDCVEGMVCRILMREFLRYRSLDRLSASHVYGSQV